MKSILYLGASLSLLFNIGSKACLGTTPANNPNNASETSSVFINVDGSFNKKIIVAEAIRAGRSGEESQFIPLAMEKLSQILTEIKVDKDPKKAKIAFYMLNAQFHFAQLNAKSAAYHAPHNISNEVWDAAKKPAWYAAHSASMDIPAT